MRMAYKSELDIQPIQWLGLPQDYLAPGEMEVIAALVRSVAAATMVEFGCRSGRTAKVLLHNVESLSRYIGVDVPKSYQPALAHQRNEMVSIPGYLAAREPCFELMIRDHGTLDLGPQDFGSVDAVFIDGDHSERVVSYDSDLARIIVRPGGVIIWHDYRNGGVEVTQVLDRLSERGWPIQAVTNTWLAFMRV